MSSHEADPDRPAPSDDLDPDTSLILDYLSNKLDPDEADRLEDRARNDKEFRYKLADMVLLKGLVTLALEKNPAPLGRACRRTRRMFLDYLRGRTSAAKTAALSRHLDECLECEMAFERLESRGAGSEDEVDGDDPAEARPRHLAIAGIVAVVLAAGGFGVFAFLSAAGNAPPVPEGVAVVAPGARIDLPAAREAAVAAAAALGDETRDLVAHVLDPATEPHEREDAYRVIASTEGARAERLLWALAEIEVADLARLAAYEALATTGPVQVTAMIAAARREAASRSASHQNLIASLAATGRDEANDYLREVVGADRGREDAWTARNLRVAYPAMRADPVVSGSMERCLRHEDEVVRAMAASVAADAGDAHAIPIALDLLGSSHPDARFHALVVLKRHATKQHFLDALSRDWSRSADIKLAIEQIMEARGLEVPKRP